MRWQWSSGVRLNECSIQRISSYFILAQVNGIMVAEKNMSLAMIHSIRTPEIRLDSCSRVAVAPILPVVEIEDQEKISDGDEGHIRCPKCGWAPRSKDRWQCICRHVWNTFDTGGVCPRCLKQWDITKCLSCHQWSPHSDWYPKH
jgi:hypothetical protein